MSKLSTFIQPTSDAHGKHIIHLMINNHLSIATNSNLFQLKIINTLKEHPDFQLIMFICHQLFGLANVESNIVALVPFN